MDVISNGISIIGLTMGLVELAKKIGVTGNWSLVLSMFLGTGLGILSQIASEGVPQGFGAWFGVSISGLALGLAASGLYDISKRTKVYNISNISEPPK